MVPGVWGVVRVQGSGGVVVWRELENVPAGQLVARDLVMLV